MKPMAASIILPYDSAHAMTTKKGVLTAQIMRAIRIGSNAPAEHRGLEKVRKLFIQNGYPKKMVNKHIRVVKMKFKACREGRAGQHERSEEQKRKRKGKVYIRLPFISDRVAARVKRVAKGSGLPVEIAWTNNQTCVRIRVDS